MRLFLAVLATCMLVPATASATVVSSQGGTITLAGTDAGEPISIAVRGGLRTLGDTYRAIGFQPGETYVAGPGCTQGGENDVECPVEGVTQILVVGGGGNDSVSLGVTTPAVRIEGGEGDDDLTLGPTQAPQVIDAGAGNDTVRVGGHPGSPTTVLGGEGDDQLTLTAGNATADGGAGNDRVVFGDPDGAPTDIAGGDGDDTLLISGPAADRIAGGAGNDTIDATNEDDDAAQPDDVTCGAGTDSTQADANDRLAADCEKPAVVMPKLAKVTAKPNSKGVAFVFTLNRNAKLRIRIERRGAGGRFKTVRTLKSQYLRPGKRRLNFRGKQVKPGRYRATLTAIAGPYRSKPSRVRFRIVK
jgi:Ca2+-binding RTX toxin-like protein